MTTKKERLRERIAREDFNIFARLPSVYAASRTQGQHLLQKGGGLSVMEWRVLWDLFEVGPMTIRELAMTQRADHSLLSRALPEMRRKGYVEMVRDVADGRKTIVTMAPAGRAAYELAAPVMSRRRAGLKDVFSEDEIRNFIGYLDRLEAFLRQPIDDIVKEEPVE
ncbi:MAG: MarR family transcriptional regulator [Pseudomonadota bacterium]